MLQLLSFKRMHERYSGMYVCMHKCMYVFVHVHVRSCIPVHYRFLGLFNGFHQGVEAVLVIVDTFRKSPFLVVRAWVSDACNPRVRACTCTECFRILTQSSSHYHCSCWKICCDLNESISHVHTEIYVRMRVCARTCVREKKKYSYSTKLDFTCDNSTFS